MFGDRLETKITLRCFPSRSKKNCLCRGVVEDEFTYKIVIRYKAGGGDQLRWTYKTPHWF
jgi:hypothetical protein